MKFQRKTPVVDALQITLTNQKAVKDFCGDDKWMLRIARNCEGGWLVRGENGSLGIDSDESFRENFTPVPHLDPNPV